MSPAGRVVYWENTYKINDEGCLCPRLCPKSPSIMPRGSERMAVVMSRRFFIVISPRH